MKTNQLASHPTPRGAESAAQVLTQPATKVMIQETPTRRYLRNSGFWTPDIQKATVFDNESAAIETANKQELKNVQLVLSRDSNGSEVLPIRTAAL